MKKVIAILLAVCMLSAVAMIGASAAVTTSAPAAVGPDWIITEIVPDSMGYGEVAGYNDNKDPFEYFEIYNNSGTTLNLYEYTVTYCGVGRTSADFETVIVETTPFKPGDFIDGSTMEYSEYGDLSNKPTNPETCMVEPGECVVIWSLYNEAYYAIFNEGKGMSIDDFRTFWDIPDDVKVIAWDGNSSASKGGHDKNFNLKNSAVGTYGIARYSEELNSMTNVVDQKYPINYVECADLICWASLDFTNQVLLGKSTANQAYNFVWDCNGAAAGEWDYTYDARRELFVEDCVDPTPGRLSPLQKAMLGQPLSAGDEIDIDFVYVPMLTEKFAGLMIDGVLYSSGVYKAEKDGVVSLEFKYGAVEGATPADTTTTAPKVEDTTTAKPVETTQPPQEDETTTVAPTPDETTTAKPADVTTKAPEENKGGCGSAVALGILALIAPAAVIICKKKED